MIVHDYGPGRIIVSLHAEIPCDMNVMEAHDIIDNAEAEIKEKFNCDISIHMDPIAVNDKKTNELKALVNDLIHQLDEKLSVHDFRITDGPLRTNLIFDLVLPFEFKLSDSQVIDYVNEKLKEKNADMIVANNLKVEGAGFGTDTNVVTLITKDGSIELPKMSKDEVADRILDKIIESM